MSHQAVSWVLFVCSLLTLAAAAPTNVSTTHARECDTLFFECHDHSCVNLFWICDGNNDCTDGSDEWNCTKGAGICESVSHGRYFTCGSGRCLDKVERCDGSDDCGDLSDEKDCFNIRTKCALGGFRCGSGACVTSAQRCDGLIDCQEDGKDEEGCTFIIEIIDMDSDNGTAHVDIFIGMLSNDTDMSDNSTDSSGESFTTSPAPHHDSSTPVHTLAPNSAPDAAHPTNETASSATQSNSTSTGHGNGAPAAGVTTH